MHIHHHAHPQPDTMILESRAGTATLIISFFLLLFTALLQSVVVYFTSSAGLLADTIHNIADALSSLPLWIAFMLSRRGPTRRFNYGLDRLEDLAGFLIVGMIVASGAIVFYESTKRLIVPLQVSHHSLGVIGALVGFAGNEIVALYKIRTGKKIQSAALIADGKHAHSDALTSLAAAFGIIAAWLHFPVADALVGMAISGFILWTAYESGKEIVIHLVDGVAPQVLEQVEHLCRHHSEVRDVYDIRARWCGRKILAELTLALDPTLDLQKAHAIAEEVRHSLLHEIHRLEDVTVHFDPSGVQHAHELTAHHFNR